MNIALKLISLSVLDIKVTKVIKVISWILSVKPTMN